MLYEAGEFCAKCGAPNKLIPDRSFDTKTGKQNTLSRCSVDPCGHYHYGHTWERLRYLGLLEYMFTNRPDHKCKVCGKEDRKNFGDY